MLHFQCWQDCRKWRSPTAARRMATGAIRVATLDTGTWAGVKLGKLLATRMAQAFKLIVAIGRPVWAETPAEHAGHPNVFHLYSSWNSNRRQVLALPGLHSACWVHHFPSSLIPYTFTRCHGERNAALSPVVCLRCKVGKVAPYQRQRGAK